MEHVTATIAQSNRGHTPLKSLRPVFDQASLIPIDPVTPLGR
ncbi:MAG: hypothetical protein ACMUIU_09865 [bacterium]